MKGRKGLFFIFLRLSYASSTLETYITAEPAVRPFARMQQIALYGPSNMLGAQMATHIASFQTRHDNRLAVPFAAR